MALKVHMTGIEDRQTPWKYAFAGYPGAGKTALASTAESPLFAFFQESPRLKSLSERAIPYVKIVDTDKISVEEQLKSLLFSLEMGDHEFKTLVIDTGDEMQQALKMSRTRKNGGSFGPGDWGWLTDTYRHLMQSFIDLPMRVIVLFHVKETSDDEGYRVRELLLQSQSASEAPGWFDIVGALDTFAVDTDDGDVVTKRVIVTQSSKLYPWVKDHSYQLPRRFEISSDFVGDIGALEAIASGQLSAEVHAEDLGELSAAVDINSSGIDTPEDVVTPEKLEEAKAQRRESSPETIPGPDEEPLAESNEADETIEEESPVVAQEDKEEEVETLADKEIEEAEKNLEEAGLVDDTSNLVVCAVCGDEVDGPMQEVSKIRFNKTLCRTHYKEEANS